MSKQNMSSKLVSEDPTVPPSHHPDSESDHEDEALLHRGQSAFYAIGLVSVLAILLYCWQFASQGLSEDQETWGQFGDFLGGLLNPAIGLVTIYLVLVNVRMQRKELKNSLQELRNSNTALKRQINASELQNFQATFFTWLNSYQNIVGSVTYSDSDGVKRIGRDGLFAAYKHQMNENNIATFVIRAGLPAGENYRMFHDFGYVEEEYNDKVRATIVKQWSTVYGRTSHHIASMFRTLYRLIRWIDEQPNTFISEAQKWHFISIARAQISDIELIYLFFNGLTSKGKNFVDLVNKYALFDNLDTGSDYVLTFLKEQVDSPYSAEAYNSDAARAALFPSPG